MKEKKLNKSFYNFLKKLLNWNTLLLTVILLIMVVGFVLIARSGDSSNNIALGCGTGLVSSGIVSLIVELIHLISAFSINKNLRNLFYNNIKKFISEFLYYASFLLDKESLNTIDMLKYQSEQYKNKAKTFDNLSPQKQKKILDDVHFLVKQRRNFKLFLSNINNTMYESAIHGIIDINTEKYLENIIYDYNWIVESFNEGRFYDNIPDIYGFLLKSVCLLIENDKNLNMFKHICFYSVEESKGIPGFIKEQDYKKLSEQDKRYLSYFSIK